MNKPLITFCVPAFNAEERIGRCIDSILAQDIPPKDREIIVVDNCSTDRTFSIVEEKLRGIENARIVRNDTNIGRIQNWNKCLDLATGRYLKFVMASDILLPQSVAGQLRIFNDHAGLVIVCCKGAALEDGRPYPTFPEVPRKEISPPIQTMKLFFEQGPVEVTLNAILFAADVISDLDLRFDERYPFAADAVFVAHLAASGAACFVNAPSYVFDISNKKRYYFVVASNADQYFVEHGVFARLVANYLKHNGVNFSYQDIYLLKRYEQWLGKDQMVTALATIKTFAPSFLLISYTLALRTYKIMQNSTPWIVACYRFLKRETKRVLSFARGILKLHAPHRELPKDFRQKEEVASNLGRPE